MKRICVFDGCRKPSRYKNGLCDGHRRQWSDGRPLAPLQARRPQVPMDGRPCAFDGCEGSPKTGGLCAGHYNQQMRGRPLTQLIGSPGYADDRFWARVDRSSDCWLWTGRTLNSGYASVSIDGAKWLVHRYAYATKRAPIPEGHVVDHVCREKLCVRPDHLRAITHLDNVRAQGLRSNNTSGVRGVNWDRARNQWVARVNVLGRKRFVGRFESLEEAAQAVAAARAKYYS